jgi:hypothetical protein
MKLSRVGIIACTMVCMLSACGGGGSSTEAPAAAAQATISGTVRDAASQPVAGVRVALGGSTVDTDGSGQYSLSVAPSAAPTNLVSFAKVGYASQTSTTTQALSSGATVRVDATVVPVGATASFNPATSATLTVSGSTASVGLPAASLVRANGSAASGPAQAQLTVIDPSVDASVMPGNFTAAGGSVAAPIESFGALQVNLVDADGSKLNLASGQSATIRIPAVSRGGAALPGTVPLFYFDESTGLWVQEGTATLQGTAPSQFYQGTVSHFTTWNADRLLDTVFLNGCVQDAAGARVGAGVLIVAGGVDYIASPSAVTDSTGAFRMAVKKNATTRLFADAGQSFSLRTTVAPGATDLTLSSCLVLDQNGRAPALVFPTSTPPATPTPTPVATYAGNYAGTYAGAEAGTFSVTISSGGVVTGTGHSTTFNINFGVVGTVVAGGTVALNAAAGTAGASSFDGTINASTGAVAGTWRYVTTPTGSTNGTFVGAKL